MRINEWLNEQNEKEKNKDISKFKCNLSGMHDLVHKLKALEPLLADSIDISFIIDCTSSMGKWIEACKNEIISITAFVKEQHRNISVRVAVVGYRDHCDDKKVEIFEFSEDV